jgi:hypothetical protein
MPLVIHLSFLAHILMAPLLGTAEIAAVLASGLPDADAVLVPEIARRE